jgi:hypothetical protein
MKLPKIIYQTNQRWLIVYKPRDWSLGSRAISKLGSIESFLAPLLRGSTKLYFPFELGTQMSGLGLACCDRGMQSQFERFRARDEMELKFRIHAPGFRNEGREPEDMTLRMDAITESEDIEIKASEYVSNRRVRNLLKCDDEPIRIHLYSLTFPDPLNPSSHILSITIPPIPTEGWK